MSPELAGLSLNCIACRAWHHSLEVELWAQMCMSITVTGLARSSPPGCAGIVEYLPNFIPNS